MVEEPVAEVARAVAAEVAPQYGDRIGAEVEAAIYGDGERGTPDRYFDVVAVGSLIVSIAGLAWQIYTDRKKNGSGPSREEIATAVRAERSKDGDLTGAEKEIIEIVSAKTVMLPDAE